jgi:hypothetical protein
LKHTDIGNVERDRDEWLLWHQTPLVSSTVIHGLIVHHAGPIRKPISRGASGKSWRTKSEYAAA